MEIPADKPRRTIQFGNESQTPGRRQ